MSQVEQYAEEGVHKLHDLVTALLDGLHAPHGAQASVSGHIGSDTVGFSVSLSPLGQSLTDSAAAPPADPVQ